MKIAIGVEYDGAGFSGWQTQPGGNTVQDALESALAPIAGERIRAVCAGRTDAGVHAVGQVVHFETSAERPREAWVRGVNTHLPPQVAVQWAIPVADEFHARFSAIERCYCYILAMSPVRPSLLAGHVGWFHHALDLPRMREAAAHLLGRHDFSAFRSAQCQAKTPEREIREIAIEQHGTYVIFRLRADAFLHHMVRNVTGCLVQVGKGSKEPQWMKAVLESRDRTTAAPTFAPDGLYLERVSYGERWQIPVAGPSPLSLIPRP